MRTITHLYDTYAEASHAVRLLEEAGIAHERIGLIRRHGEDAAIARAEPGESRDADGTRDDETIDTDHDTLGGGSGSNVGGDLARPPTGGAGSGATLGTVLGGGAGLLAGLGTLSIPGVGPVVAAGWLVAAVTGAGAGAAAGGLLGALVGSDTSDHDAVFYADGVRRGGTIVSVRADDADAERIQTVLAATGPLDSVEGDDDARVAGWSKYQEAARDYRPGSSAAARPVIAPGERAGAGYPTDADRAAEATEAAIERERERLPGV